MTNTIDRALARLFLGAALLAGAPSCAPASTVPDAELMAGWAKEDVAIGESHLLLEHPNGWAFQSEKLDDSPPAGGVHMTVPRDFGPRLLMTAFATPPGFPTEEGARKAKVQEMLKAAVGGVTGTSPTKLSEVMETQAQNGGTYEVIGIIDETLPEEPTSPEKFKYVTIGVMAHDGWILNFTVLHHEPAPPENEALLGVVRTARIAAKP